MECQLVVKDFKKIKSAKVTVKGFTVLSAANAHGKSTLFDSIIKTLDNDFSDEYYRHGTDSYLIGIKLKDEDQEQSLIVKRVQGTNYLSFNNSEFHSKLGRAGLNQVCPEFNLKRIDYEAVKIYPNFALQGKIPMFEDISPTELLSSLYSDVFRISKKTADSKKNIAIRSEEVKKINSQILYVQEQANEVKSDYAKIDPDKINSDYQSLQSYLNLNQEISDLQSEIDSLGLSDEELQIYSKYESLVESAVQFKPQYEQFKQFKPKAEQLESYKQRLDGVQLECNKFSGIKPELQFLIDSGMKFDAKKARLAKLEMDLKPYDTIDNSLMKLLQFGIGVPNMKQDLVNLETEISGLDTQIHSIQEQLKDTACPTLLQLGYCPYSK